MLSVFKLQYYAVALVGAVVVLALLLESAGPARCVWVASLAYAIVMISLSFTRLVGR
jgi:energy-converting hydrogenase Eha subunit A